MPYVEYMGPAWFRKRLLDLLPDPKVQRVKRLTSMVYNRSKEIFEAKKAAIKRGDQEMLHTVGEGKDVMSILRRFPLWFSPINISHFASVKANMMASAEDKLPDEELLAQMAYVTHVSCSTPDSS